MNDEKILKLATRRERESVLCLLLYQFNNIRASCLSPMTDFTPRITNLICISNTFLFYIFIFIYLLYRFSVSVKSPTIPKINNMTFLTRGNVNEKNESNQNSISSLLSSSSASLNFPLIKQLIMNVHSVALFHYHLVSFQRHQIAIKIDH